jgi:ribosome biogenesis ATPase
MLSHCFDRILKVLSTKLRLAGDFDFRALAKATPGYVGADLSALTGAAGIIAVKRIFQDLGIAVSSDAAPEMIEGTIAEDMILDPPSFEGISLENSNVDQGKGTQIGLREDGTQRSIFDNLPPELQILSIAAFLKNHPNPLTEEQLEPLSISLKDFQEALKHVQPSSKREGFTTMPDVTWSNVGALDDIRDELRMAIVQPVKHPELFEAVGIANPCGVLLWGPPGCGKTLLAKAVANESRANFISVKGPELLNKVSFSCRSLRNEDYR